MYLQCCYGFDRDEWDVLEPALDIVLKTLDDPELNPDARRYLMGEVHPELQHRALLQALKERPCRSGGGGFDYGLFPHYDLKILCDSVWRVRCRLRDLGGEDTPAVKTLEAAHPILKKILELGAAWDDAMDTIQLWIDRHARSVPLLEELDSTLPSLPKIQASTVFSGCWRRESFQPDEVHRKFAAWVDALENVGASITYRGCGDESCEIRYEMTLYQAFRIDRLFEMYGDRFVLLAERVLDHHGVLRYTEEQREQVAQAIESLFDRWKTAAQPNSATAL